MGRTFAGDPPVALRHAGDELIMALCAETPEGEAEHRNRADVLIREAVVQINDDRHHDD